MPYVPSTLTLGAWSSPITIVGTDNVAQLDEAVNLIITGDPASLLNHINTELAKIPTYLTNELSAVAAAAIAATDAARIAAQAAQTAAEAAATAALASQTAAAASATAASASATSAAASASAAETAKTAAQTAQTAAETAKTAAQAAQAAAETAATNANTYAGNALASANAAATSASAAATSATNAAGSATAAAASASAADTSATNAAASATAAAASAALAASYADWHVATEKTTPVDADEMGLVDSAAAWALKKVTWANIKATLKTYFDTLYGKLATANTWSSTNTFNGEVTVKETKETVYNLTGTAIDPANGTVQYKVLAGNTTFTEALQDGQSVTLRLANGSSWVVTFPTMTWVTAGGNVQPILTASDVIVFWKEGTTLYGAYVGSGV